MPECRLTHKQEEARKFIEDSLKDIITRLIDNPKDLTITPFMKPEWPAIQIKVNPADYGRVIGHQGTRLEGFRKIFQGIAKRNDFRIDIEVAS